MSSRLISTIFCTGLALLAFGAVYWPAALGSLTASPGIPLIAVAVLCAPLVRHRRGPLFEALRLERLLWVPVAGSVLSLGLFGWNPLFAGKFFTVGLLSLIWLSPLLLVDRLSMRTVQTAAMAGAVICILGYVLSDLTGALPSVLHNVIFGGDYADYSDVRPRGFAEEPSQFSAVLSRFVLVWFLIDEARRPYKAARLITFFVALAVGLVLLSSKGAVLSIALALLSFTLGRRQLPWLLPALPLSLWLVNTQLESLTVDIEQFTSVSTRLGMTLTGIVSLAVNPLGYGYYGFYGAVQHFGGWSIGWLSERLPLLMTEMQDIVDNLTYVSTKSIPFDFGMVFGWLFFVLLVQVGRLINLRDPRARAAGVFLLSSSMSTSGHSSITFFLGLAVLLRLYPSRASPLRQ